MSATEGVRRISVRSKDPVQALEFLHDQACTARRGRFNRLVLHGVPAELRIALTLLRNQNLLGPLAYINAIELLA